MPLDLPESEAALAFTSVWVARALVDDWHYGPIATVEVDGAPLGVAYSDEDEAYERMPSPDHELFETSVSDVLLELPPGTGLVVDPHAPRPRVVAAQDGDRVLRLGMVWAPGVPFVLHEVDDAELDGFLSDLREVLARYPQLGRVWCLGYEVVGGPAILCVVADDYYVDLSSCVLEALEQWGGEPRYVLSLLGDVPAAERRWFEEHPPLNS